MKLLLDLQAAQSDSRYRGMGRYSLSLALAMAQQATKAGHEVHLLLNSAFGPSVLDARAAFAPWVSHDRIHVFQPPLHVAQVHQENHWRSYAGELLREYFIAHLKMDVVHISSLFEGFGDDAVTSIGELEKISSFAALLGKKTLDTSSYIVTTLYDLIPYIYPNDYLGNETVQNWYRRKIESLQRSGALLAISDSSRQEVTRELKYEASRVTNISAGVDPHFKAPVLTHEQKQTLLARYGIVRNFLIFAPGGFDKRKNFARLMQAYARLPHPLRENHQLVIASKLSKDPRDDSRAKLYALRDEAHLREDELVLTDYVPEADLIALYSMARLFVFPSFHEGFGLPPLEAMSCGCVIVGSNVSSIPEVIGLPDALFDPYDEQNMSEKIAQALTDESFRSKFLAHSAQHTQTFAWSHCARTALAAIEDFQRQLPPPSERGLPTQTQLLRAIAQLPRHAHAPETDLVRVANALAANEAYLQRLTKELLPSQRIQKDFLHSNTKEAVVLEDFPPLEQAQLLLDITELVKHDARTGIQRVVRSILLQLFSNIPDFAYPRAIYFDGAQYRYADTFMSRFLSESSVPLPSYLLPHNAPIADRAIDIAQGDIYFALTLNPALGEVAHALHQQWQYQGVHVFFIVYDILLISRPDWAPQEASENFKAWTQHVLQVATGALCISQAVADELLAFDANNPSSRPTPVQAKSFHLGADVENSAPTKGLPPNAAATLENLQKHKSFLTVGTIEPRKGHQQILTAFEELWQQGEAVNLVIIGKSGWLMDSLVVRLRNHPQLNKHLFLFEGISDEYLEHIYAACACLIYASEGEGFGLPLIEAARHKLPILTRDLPVFREVAQEHASYFKGLSGASLAKAVRHWLALDAENAAPPSSAMPYITWQQSAQQLVQGLKAMLP